MIEEIIKSKMNFIQRTGRKPKYLYVGQDEYYKLKQSAEIHFKLTNIDYNGSGDYFIAGLQVMHVLIDSHFNIV